MNKHFRQSVVGVFAGVVQLATGAWLAIFVETGVLSWALIAIGVFIFLANTLGAVGNRQAKKNIEGSQELKNILSDEREAAIGDKSGAITNDFTNWAVWAAIIVLAVMQVDIWIPLVLIGVQFVRMVVGMVALLWLRKTM
jgi:hypothetical protein